MMVKNKYSWQRLTLIKQHWEYKGHMLNNLGTIDTGLTLLAQQLVFYVKKILINYFLFQANALW